MCSTGRSKAGHGYVAGYASRKRSETNDRLLCRQCPYTPVSASARPAVPGDLADRRIATVEDAVEPGEEIEVKVIAADSMGRINLYRRALTDKARDRTTEESQRGLAPVLCMHIARPNWYDVPGFRRQDHQ